MVAEQPTADAVLLRAAAGGDPDAVRTMLDEAGAVVYGFIRARLGGDESATEDLVQETFVEAVRGAATFRGDSALTTWLCAIARRRVARHFEAERRRAGLADAHADAMSEPDGFAAVDRHDELVRALGRLPATHRHVLVRKYLDGLSVEQIADELARSRVQVQSLLQRARDGLRAELGATGA